MPMYDFYCEQCDRTQELLAKAEEPVYCQHCGLMMTKLIGAPNAHFKGPGFYATEHGNQRHNRRK